jgi:antirestriction protein ArdC
MIIYKYNKENLMTVSKGKFAPKEERDHYQEFTESIVARIEEALEHVDKGLTWERPIIECTDWPFNFNTGERYKGGNVAFLASAEFMDPRFGTFKQMQDEANKTGKTLQLEKGSKATYVMKVIPVYVRDEDGEITKNGSGQPIPAVDASGKQKIGIKWYAVFNASQIIGMEPYVKPNLEVKPFEVVEILSAALKARTGLKVEHSAVGQAYYSPAQHKVHMANPSMFKSSEAYADTFFHETGHSTGPALGRKMDGGFGSSSYAQEELVAELSSCFMAMEMGIPHNPASHENHAAYMRSWLKALKDDKKYIFAAVSLASKAVEYQMGHYNAYKKDLVKTENIANEITAPFVEKPKQEKRAVATM